MKILLTILMLISSVKALSFAEISNWYSEGKYKQICQEQVEKFYIKTRIDAVLNLYGMACLNTHMINRLSTPIFGLTKSKQARENAAYFADILYKKKLLYYAVIDGVDISYIRLPKSDYILSYIFDRFTKGDYEKDDEIFIFKEPNSDTYYELGKSELEYEIPRIFIRTYKDDELINEIEYW